jgi:predicted metal-dependent phosphoesterase TrpH
MTIQAQAREDRAEKITEVLQRLGFDVALPQVQALAGLGVVGRPHFAQHLVATGQIPSMTMAFKRVLGSGKPGDIKANWPTLETAVGWITDAGGIAVVAHPMKYNMTLTKLRALLSDFVAAGGQGLEVLTGYQDAQRINALADLAHRFDLYASAGSDFHQPGQPWAELGRVAALPDRCVPVWTLWS